MAYNGRWGKTPKMPLGWERRQHRLAVIIRAFVRFDGDIATAVQSFLEEADEETRAKYLEDKWFSRDFSKVDAQTLLEEGLMINLVTQALIPGNSQALKASQTLLMALNKERYNPSVQAAGKLNEGIVEGLRAFAARPMSHQQVAAILIGDQKYIPVKEMAALPTPSLDEAIEMTKKDGKYVENVHLREDKDLSE